ncbi:MAG: T9SS type A sorting domain-containing protein [Ignavibacteriales bacterium]|nr:T9SS type A sorting domain-containing protein [Ignavibacteriales bacterium]
MKCIQSKMFSILVLVILFNAIFLTDGFCQTTNQIPCTGEYRWLNVYPDGPVSWGEDQLEVQGITHDDANWYITATDRSGMIDQDIDNCYLWKIPVTEDLNENVFTNPNVTSVNLYQLSPLWNGNDPLSGYIHWGDLDHYQYDGVDYLTVPVTSPSKPSPAIIIFRASSLTIAGIVVLPGEPGKSQKDIGWCAVNPNSGDLYTSNDSTSIVFRYQISWGRLRSTGYQATLPVYWKATYQLTDGISNSDSLLDMHNMQGGEFTPSGDFLYLSNGRGSCKGQGASDAGHPNDGINIFDTGNWDTKSFRRIKHSVNRCYESPGVSDCGHPWTDCFDLTYDFGCGAFESHSDQPQGLTIWDIDKKGAPNMFGQLHVLVASIGLGGNMAQLHHYNFPLCLSNTIAPSISRQPSDVSAIKGTPATFSISASGSRIRFQWQKDGVSIFGANEPTYTIKSVWDSDNGTTFRCIVSNCTGSVVSNSAVCTVLFPPSITLQPKRAITVPAGQPVTFYISASGDPILTYQWQKNCVDIPDATSPSFTTPMSAVSDSGTRYRCIVKNPYGTAISSECILRVIPRIPSTNLIFNSGFESGITDWFTAGDVLFASAGYEQDSSLCIPFKPNQTRSLYQESFGLDPSTQYRLRVAGKSSTNIDTVRIKIIKDSSPWTLYCDSITIAVTPEWQCIDTVLMSKNFSGMIDNSRLMIDFGGNSHDHSKIGDSLYFDNIEFTRVVDGTPSITVQPQDQYIIDGSWATFSITATSATPMTYQWLKNGFPIEGGNGSSVTLPRAVFADSGARIRCIVRNARGSTSSKTVMMHVISANLIQNSDFQFGKMHWFLSDTVNGAFDIHNFDQNFAAAVNVVQTGKDVRLFQNRFGLGPVTKFRVRFHAMAAHERDTVQFFVSSESSPNVKYSVPFTVIPLRNVWQQFDTILTTTNLLKTVGDACINFAFKFASHSTVYLDDVRWEVIDKRIPFVTLQPTDQKIFEGMSVAFAANVVGVPPISYQWLRNDTPITGETSPNLTMNALDISESGAKYRCILSNQYGKTSTRSTALTIVGNLVINSGFEQGKIGWNSSDSTKLLFSMRGPGYLGKYAVQIDVNDPSTKPTFYQSGIQIESYMAYNISYYARSEKEYDTLVTFITSDTSSHATFVAPIRFYLGKEWRKYDTIIVTKDCSNMVTGAMLNFLIPGSSHRRIYLDEVTLKRITGGTAPIITRNPVDRTVTAGDPATFSIQVIGEAPLTYHWQKNGVDIPGATSPRYSIQSASRSDSGSMYRCLIVNDYGMVASEQAKLAVITSGRMNGIQVVAIQAGWNMVSVPLTVPDSRKSEIFPMAMGDAYGFNQMYEVCDTLLAGRGYWIKFPTTQSITISGSVRTSDTISVSNGWNLIGCPSDPVRVESIQSEPVGLLTSQFYNYNGEYVAASTLEPGKGYWVKMIQPGKLILNSASLDSKAMIKISSSGEVPPPSPDGSLEQDNKDAGIPSKYELSQNYPNPFNPVTTIKYQLPQDVFVSLKVYNILGEEVTTLVSGEQTAGYKSVEFDGSMLSTGTYIYMLKAGNYTNIKKLLLLK